MGGRGRGYVCLVAPEAEHYDVYEAARILGLSPARVRQMLRSGELEGERAEERAQGIPGPWMVGADSVRAMRAGQEDTQRGDDQEDAGEDVQTVAMVEGPAEGISAKGPDRPAGGTPSRAAELLSESVRGLVERVDALRRELEQLEGRLEFSEIQEFALQESLKKERERAERERERADALQARLDAERRERTGGEQLGTWRRLFGG